MSKIRVVHYVNQFFAGIGGEDKADISPAILEKNPPVSMQLGKLLADDAELVGVVVCGDSYFNENLETAKKEVLDMIASLKPDMVIAGPAFNAGRYGMACATVCDMVQKELHIKAFTAMYDENPGVDVFRKQVYIVKTKNSAAGMRDALPAMAKFAKAYINDPENLDAEELNFFPKGVRQNIFREERGSMRAVNMLVKKLKGEEFKTEFPMPEFDRVEPGKAIADIKKAKIALVTSGGIVPKGNPDHIESSSASKYGAYDISKFMKLSSADHETAHGGYDPTYANDQPDRVLPVDVLRELEKAGEIGELYNTFFTTVGNGTSVANSKAFAAEFSKKLLEDGVDAVVLTSTWGTCTRCGATMVKEIERTGIPVVHMCTVVPISLTVGANRIVPTVAIPYPLGNPALTLEQEHDLRMKLVKKALKALETPVDTQTVFED